MYRKDGIANLDVITLVTKVVDIVRVSMCVCVYLCVHVCMGACPHMCVRAYVRLCIYMH